MDEAFFLPLGDDRWQATIHTTGPWDARFQHGGPPAALLARAVERCAPREEMIVARVTVEILGPVPVAEVEVRARVLRPGRSVELVEAVLSSGGRDAARAAAWRVTRTTQPGAPSRHEPAPPVPDLAPPDLPVSDLAVSDLAVSDLGPSDVAAPHLPAPAPAALAPAAPVDGWVDGYLSAVEWRFVTGRFDRPGPATVWSRLRYPLVPDEEPSALQRVLSVADSGNGLSSELDLTAWHFINPELTVHLHREAVGPWVCVDAQTVISPGGAGLATTVLHDVQGPVGVGAQSLLVAPR